MCWLDIENDGVRTDQKVWMDIPEKYQDRLAWLHRTRDLDTFAQWAADDFENEPDQTKAILAHAEALGFQGRFDERLAILSEAQPRWPSHTMMNISLGLEHMSRGDYQTGWPYYEARRSLKDGGAGKPKPPENLRWTGQSVAGKEVLIVQEQGLGDTIQFVRAAIDLQRAGARPLLDVQGPLRPLFAASPALGRILEHGTTVQASYWMGMLDAVPHLTPTLADVTWPGTYISPPVTEPIVPRKAGLRVGVCWAGSANFLMNDFRTISLPELAHLADVPGCNFYSLMMPPGPQQIADAGFDHWLHDLSEVTQPFERLAAVIDQLDAVVSVCTSIAHLAAAMGKPTYLMLSTIGEWRWARGRDTTPWYPSMRLIRQRRFGDWSDVVDDVASELSKL